MSDLVRASVAIIEAAQTPSGAILAAPTFPVYRYCWFRDASFAAHALDLVGRHEASARFFSWGDEVVARYAPHLEDALRRHAEGVRVPSETLLHCRYTAAGEEGAERWGNFQMDGYGSFLWALAYHLERLGRSVGPFRDTVSLLIRYIEAFWEFPQYDCWEEEEGRYPATLACLYGGLRAAARLVPSEAMRALAVAERIRARVLTDGVRGGRLVKQFGRDGIDASLLWCIVPFGLVDMDGPIAHATVSAVEQQLLQGGVHRFPEDTYYGGGAWIVLTAWLGWWYQRVGRRREAHELLEWIEAQAGADGDLPEQVQQSLLAPAYLEVWKGRWGPPASPLVWSHAMYLVLHDAVSR